MVSILHTKQATVTPYQFGARGGSLHIPKGTVTTASSPVINNASGPFQPSHVGKIAYIAGATASGGVYASTVVSYQSPTQITLNVPISTALSDAQVVIGVDDTAAVQAALDYAVTKGKTVVLDSMFLTGPLTIKTNGAIVGTSRAAGLMLRPSTAIVNKYLLRNATTSDHSITVASLTLNGLREFQTDGSGVVLEDINTLEYLGSVAIETAIGEAYILFRDLLIINAGRAALAYLGRGLSTISGITTRNSFHGLHLTINDSLISDVNVSSAKYQGINLTGSRNKFTNCITTKCGWDGTPMVNRTGWLISTANFNTFANCSANESWQSGVKMVSSNANTFVNFNALDIACLFPIYGLGTDNSAGGRVAFTVGTCRDNNFVDCRAGPSKHALNYCGYAAQFSGVGSNFGNIYIAPDAPDFTSALVQDSDENNNVYVGIYQDRSWYLE